ncbi:MAG: hypothetical protein EHM41_06440 [Chloroflexi bacterium]|nr:MAG: hypothetical protein EHM41_06440 [Chloroflexota bacterium]
MRIEKGRLGQFFLFIGLLLLVIFFLAGKDETPPARFFFAGAFLTGLGTFMIWKDWKPGPPSGRFRLLRGKRKAREGEARSETER